MSKVLKIKIKPFNEFRYNEGTNWGLYAFDVVEAVDDEGHELELRKGKYGNYSLNGTMQRLKLNVTYTAEVKEVEHSSYGWGYEADKIYQELPLGTKAQKMFFGAILTENQVKNIYEVYTEDDDVIQLMRDNEFDYTKIKGFGEVTYPAIREKVLDYYELQDAIVKLDEYDIEPKLIMKLVKHFGSSGMFLQKLEDNPYCLTEVSGIGFIKADAIAKSVGYDLDSPHRIDACIEYVIEQNENNGDTYIKHNKLLSECATLLKIKKPLIKERIKSLDKLVEVDGKIALEKTFSAESSVAKWLLERHANSVEIDFDVDEFVTRMEKKYDISLTDQQKSFFQNIKESSVNFLVGFAGCGKSMLQKLLIDLLEEKKLSFSLLAPTGKASKVLSGYTKRPAYTIHKKVGIGQNNEDFQDVQLWDDFIIIDESSMCGITLVNILLNKLRNPNVRVLFIGDSFQLPSVDKGNFLYDCQNSGVFAVTMLDIVFRQSEGGVLDIVTKIRKGEKFIENDFIGVRKFGKDCILVSSPQEKMEKGYLHYYNELIEKYGIDNVLVLSPTKKSTLGTYAINNELQEIANPLYYQKQIALFKDKNEYCLREKDNVINTQNSYKMKTIFESEIDVMNGDTGKVVSINEESRTLVVDFDGNKVVYGSNDLIKLLHSFCITMHKSQGSSSDAVIAISDKSHKFQINANLLYTAWTRTRGFLVILCQADVINYAIKKVANLSRNTFLEEILKGDITYDGEKANFEVEESA